MSLRKTIAKTTTANLTQSNNLLSGNMKTDLQTVIKRLFDEQDAQFSAKTQREQLIKEWSLRVNAIQLMLNSKVEISESSMHGILELHTLAKTKLRYFVDEQKEEVVTKTSIKEQIVAAQTLLHKLEAVEVTSRLRNAMALNSADNQTLTSMSGETLSREVQRVIHTAEALIELKSVK